MDFSKLEHMRNKYLYLYLLADGTNEAINKKVDDMLRECIKKQGVLPLVDGLYDHSTRYGY